mmetsp:Transcript_2033/g.6358  ORF Transcript_2033/g.6358 Transcript_2033/m.6358 type:complete len:750 (+) Transcript_2033:30-2279(+)
MNFAHGPGRGASVPTTSQQYLETTVSLRDVDRRGVGGVVEQVDVFIRDVHVEEPEARAERRLGALLQRRRDALQQRLVQVVHRRVLREGELRRLCRVGDVRRCELMLPAREDRLDVGQRREDLLHRDVRDGRHVHHGALRRAAVGARVGGGLDLRDEALDIIETHVVPREDVREHMAPAEARRDQQQQAHRRGRVVHHREQRRDGVGGARDAADVVRQLLVVLGDEAGEAHRRVVRFLGGEVQIVHCNDAERGEHVAAEQDLRLVQAAFGGLMAAHGAAVAHAVRRRAPVVGLRVEHLLLGAVDAHRAGGGGLLRGRRRRDAATSTHEALRLRRGRGLRACAAAAGRRHGGGVLANGVAEALDDRRQLREVPLDRVRGLLRGAPPRDVQRRRQQLHREHAHERGAVADEAGGEAPQDQLGERLAELRRLADPLRRQLTSEHVEADGLRGREDAHVGQLEAPDGLDDLHPPCRGGEVLQLGARVERVAFAEAHETRVRRQGDEAPVGAARARLEALLDDRFVEVADAQERRGRRALDHRHRRPRVQAVGVRLEARRGELRDDKVEGLGDDVALRREHADGVDAAEQELGEGEQALRAAAGPAGDRRAAADGVRARGRRLSRDTFRNGVRRRFFGVLVLGAIVQPVLQFWARVARVLPVEADAARARELHEVGVVRALVADDALREHVLVILKIDREAGAEAAEDLVAAEVQRHVARDERGALHVVDVPEHEREEVRLGRVRAREAVTVLE